MNFIMSTNPRNTAENVALDHKIEFMFMVDINRQLLKKEHVILFNMTEQQAEPCEFVYKNRNMTITPTHKLQPAMHYQVIIMGGERGIRDITGRFLPQSYELEFETKTVDHIKPPVIIAPADLSEVSDNFQFEWDIVLEADHYQLQISKSNTFRNLVWPTENQAVYENIVTPMITFEVGEYYARIRSVDWEGVPSAWSTPLQFFFDNRPKFVNGTYDVQDPILADDGQPTIVSDGEEVSGDEQIHVQAKVSKKKFSIQANSKVQKLNALTNLQQHFHAKTTEDTKLYITKTFPKHKTLNVSPEKVKEIVIEFTENIDPQTVSNLTCYLIGERN